MDYLEAYRLLMYKARHRNVPLAQNVYIEKHHILPRSMGGSDMVKLTLKEHYIAHRLLEAITRGTKYHHKMIAAVLFMSNIHK